MDAPCVSLCIPYSWFMFVVMSCETLGRSSVALCVCVLFLCACQCGVWETLLTALEVLIRVHHPHQVFNIRQFLKAEVVHRFLLTCQVLQVRRLQPRRRCPKNGAIKPTAGCNSVRQEHRDEHLTAIPQEVCLSFVKIIQEVLGSPPDLELLKLIYNFLLAVHPPTNTYVCHTPTSFYFSLHISGWDVGGV